MKEKTKSYNLVAIAIIYLAGIFMGAIDTGIVTPARTIIQNNFGLDAQTGIWMITIYTLAYAASIPIMGKLADIFGRKTIYITCITLFGAGSLLCGLSQSMGGFTLLLLARVIQAIGGGGILPIATAELGTSFPEEKRGMALGLVGGVYGLANIFGASAGSLILDIFGTSNWQFIFYINIPITIFIIIGGIFYLNNQKSTESTKLDLKGIAILTAMILSLLYGLKNLDFFNIRNSILQSDVYPFLLAFILLLPLFIWVEKKAANPVMNLKYFTNRNILITLLISFISGIVIMGMIFVPQFSENLLKIPTGSGGYLVIILGLFAGIGAPVSGALIDKFGVKSVLSFGFVVSILGSLFLMFVTTAYPGFLTVFIGLMLTGLGIGFTMGTPINYMMLKNTDDKESNSALATVSLVRSIGTAIAPAIMIGFIAHAGLSVQTNVMNLLPTEISMPQLPYVQDISYELDSLKNNEQMKSKLGNMEIPDLTEMQTVKFDMSGNSDWEMPDDLLELMKNSDVTTITDNSKTLATRMFDMMTPEVINNITGGLDKGISGIGTGIEEMNKAIKDMKAGRTGIGKGISGMESAVKAQKTALTQLQAVKNMLAGMGGVPIPPGMTLADLIPPYVKASMPEAAIKELARYKSVADLDKGIADLEGAISTLQGKIRDSKNKRDQMTLAISKIETSRNQMLTLQNKIASLEEAVPGAFKTAKTNYVKVIDDKGQEIETVFQNTLNEGFKNIYLTSAVVSAVALILLAFYRERKMIQD